MTSVEDYQTRTEALAGASAARVLAVYAGYQAGQLAADQAAELISGVVNLANAGAVSLADMFIAAQIEELAGVPTPVTGAAPTDEHERLLEAVHTILSEQPADPDEPGQAQTRLERLARSEPLETAQRAATEAMQEQPLVQGWTRAMDSDPCPLCVIGGERPNLAEDTPPFRVIRAATAPRGWCWPSTSNPPCTPDNWKGTEHDRADHRDRRCFYR